MGSFEKEDIKRGCSALGWGKCLDSKRVYVCLKQLAERIINHPVALYAIYTVKYLRHDGDVKVALAVPGAFMAHMQLTLVLDQ